MAQQRSQSIKIHLTCSFPLAQTSLTYFRGIVISVPTVPSVMLTQRTEIVLSGFWNHRATQWPSIGCGVTATRSPLSSGMTGSTLTDTAGPEGLNAPGSLVQLTHNTTTNTRPNPTSLFPIGPPFLCVAESCEDS